MPVRGLGDVERSAEVRGEDVLTSSTDRSSNAALRSCPALLTTISTDPNASIAACTIAAPPAGVATELASVTAVPPASRIACAAPSAPSSSMSLHTTAAPRAANASA